MKRLMLFIILVLLAHIIGCGNGPQTIPTEVTPYYLHWAGGQWHYIRGPFDTEDTCQAYNQKNLNGAFGYCNQNAVCEVAFCH